MKIREICDVEKTYKLVEKIYYLAVEFERSGRQVQEGRIEIFATIAQSISDLKVNEEKLKELGWNNNKVVEGEEAERAIRHAGWIRKDE